MKVIINDQKGMLGLDIVDTDFVNKKKPMWWYDGPLYTQEYLNVLCILPTMNREHVTTAERQ